MTNQVTVTPSKSGFALIAQSDFSAICRICLEQNVLLFPIIGTAIAAVKVRKLLRYSMKITVRKNDLLPQKICSSCMTELYKSSIFMKKCYENDTALKSLLNQKFDSQRFILRKKDHITSKNRLEPDCVQSPDPLAQPQKKGPETLSIRKNKDLSTTCATMGIDDLTSVPNPSLSSLPDNSELPVVDEDPYKDIIKDGPFKGFPKPERFQRTVVDPNKPSERSAKKMYPCIYCGKKFRRFILKQHLELHKKQRSYQCPLCKLSYNIQAHLSRHLRSHKTTSSALSSPRYLCSQCGKSFSRINTLSKHEKMHSVNVYNCVCGRIFRSIMTCKKHLRLYASDPRHGTEKIPQGDLFRCDFCGLDCGNDIALNKHLPECRNDKLFLCNYCGESFRVQAFLNRHLKKHIRQFQCELCGKALSSLHSLKQHLQIHTGERPFRCTLCPKSFRRPESLASHLRCHTDEKPYSCPFCSMTFRSRYCKALHLKRHTGERPYKNAKTREKFAKLLENGDGVEAQDGLVSK